MAYAFNNDKSKFDLDETLDNVDNIAGSLATIEVSPAVANHAAGEYILYDNVLYEVISPIATGESLVLGTNVRSINIGDQLKALQDSIVYIKEVTSGGKTWRLMQYPDSTVIAYTWWTGIALPNFTAWGNLYESKVLDPVTYPITFSEVPTVRIEPWGNSYVMLAYTLYGEGTKTRSPYVYAVRPDTLGNGKGVGVGMIVTGKAPSIR